MALSPLVTGLKVGQGGWFDNGVIGGTPDLWATPTTPAYPVGTKFTMRNGRVFRYAQFVAAVTHGWVVAPDISEVGITTALDNALTAAAIGATSIVVTSASFFSGTVAADALAGGYLITEAGAGSGYAYLILSNTAGSSNASTLTIEDPGLIAAVTTATDIQIVPPPYWKLIGASTTDNQVCGVVLAEAAAADYGWIQTAGPAVVLVDETAGTAAFGVWATLSDSVQGAVNPAAGVDTSVADLKTDPYIGKFLTDGTDTDYAAVDLALSW